MAARPSEVVPVPAALFGPLLERVTDAASLRCALRAVFVLHRKQGRPAVVTAAELAADPVLGLGGDEASAERALESLAELGVLLRAEAGYCLDTPANRRALAAGTHSGGGAWGAEPSTKAGTGPRPDVFRLYEENIGLITPMVAELLKDMETEYPQEWIVKAFGEAVRNNRHSLSYVEAILRRWRDDGRGDGTAGGRARKIRVSEAFQRPLRK